MFQLSRSTVPQKEPGLRRYACIQFLLRLLFIFTLMFASIFTKMPIWTRMGPNSPEWAWFGSRLPCGIGCYVHFELSPSRRILPQYVHNISGCPADHRHLPTRDPALPGSPAGTAAFYGADRKSVQRFRFASAYSRKLLKRFSQTFSPNPQRPIIKIFI